MKKVILIACFIASVSIFAVDTLDTQLKSLENQLNLLEKQEAKRREQMAEEKKTLEKELADLQGKVEANGKIKEKLSGDSMIRWHRDEYKKLLDESETYEKSLKDVIKVKEQKLSNINAMLEVM